MEIDLTENTPPPAQKEGTQLCPLCNESFPASIIQEHCETHFNTDLLPLPSMSFILCSLCNLSIPLDEFESHEAAHSIEQNEQHYTEEDNDQDTKDKSLADSLYLQQLRSYYGFETPQHRPGSCFICNQPGHWAYDCPKNRLNEALKRRILSDPTHEACISAQQQEKQPFHRDLAGKLFSLLTRRLSEQSMQGYSSIEVYLCSPTAHFGGQPFDASFGCGYRNIQMQIAYLFLSQQREKDNTPDVSVFTATDLNDAGDGYGIATPSSLSARKSTINNTNNNNTNTNTNTNNNLLVDDLNGVIPDISSLQSWIECAWKHGFDPEGAEQLEHQVQGTRKWIGTTEAAVLLRYFGCHATIVDFGVLNYTTTTSEKSEKSEKSYHSSEKDVVDAITTHPITQNTTTTAATNITTITTTADSLLKQEAHNTYCDNCNKMVLSDQTRYDSQIIPQYSLCEECYQKLSFSSNAGPFKRKMVTREMKDIPSSTGNITACDSSTSSGSRKKGRMHGDGEKSIAGRCLLEWIWNTYYGNNNNINNSNNNNTITTAHTTATTAMTSGDAANAARIIQTTRPPLYFQHDGHSRTIIGIERRVPQNCSTPPEYSLLLFDPGVTHGALHDALVRGQGWQRLIKRRSHTLREKQFQLMYVPEGSPIENERFGEEYDALKTVTAAERY